LRRRENWRIAEEVAGRISEAGEPADAGKPDLP
jgi:hypothetical protein